MLECTRADDADIQEAFRQVHAVWPHDPDPTRHLAARLASVQHQRATWFVGKKAGRVISSLGAYPYHAFGPDGRRPVRVLGAIYTVPEERGHGYAGQLIRWVLQHYREQSVGNFALFSDIGTHYYQGFGFQALPSYEWELSVPPEPGPEDAELVSAPIEPTQAGTMGCAYGFDRQAEESAWVWGKHAGLRLTRWQSQAAASPFWLLSRRNAEQAYLLLESNLPQDALHWDQFRRVVQADARRYGESRAQGWWTSAAVAPGERQTEVLPRDKEILMWLNLRGPIDSWERAIQGQGFRVLLSEHV
jgi:predicted N-acetyltransferase YhbS